MSEIVVEDLTHVTVDGVSAGSVTDVLMNFATTPGVRGDLLRAIQAWDDARVKAANDRMAAHQAAYEAAFRAEQDRLQAEVDDLRSQVDALGGTPLAKRMHYESLKRAAHATSAEAEAKLAELDAASPH